MRVLHLISSGGMYGAEAVILNLSHALQQAGDVCVIASFRNASSQLHERALAEHVPAVLVDCEGQLSASAVKSIRAAVTQHRIQLVHAHGYKADLYAWAALRGTGVALVSTCHTWYDNDLALRVYGALDRWVLRRYARVVAVSAEVEERLLHSGVKAGRVRRIRNGVDPVPFAAAAVTRSRRAEGQGALEGRLTAGLVGRLSQEKGVDVFVEAAGQVHRQLPHARFCIAGEGPERTRLQEQIESLGLGSCVQLLGRQEDMVAAYAGMDLLVSASRQEGLPIALLEGMASGLPLVATAVGEVPTLVVPGETGLLVAPMDAAALADAMVHVLSQQDLRRSMGCNARALVEREFSVSRMAAEYRQVYGEALSENGAGA